MISFFFQAEDGIRDWSVTGVQTCALPIWFAGPVSVSRLQRRGALGAAQTHRVIRQPGKEQNHHRQEKLLEPGLRPLLGANLEDWGAFGLALFQIRQRFWKRQI